VGRFAYFAVSQWRLRIATEVVYAFVMVVTLAFIHPMVAYANDDCI